MEKETEGEKTKKGERPKSIGGWLLALSLGFQWVAILAHGAVVFLLLLVLPEEWADLVLFWFVPRRFPIVRKVIAAVQMALRGVLFATILSGGLLLVLFIVIILSLGIIAYVYLSAPRGDVSPVLRCERRDIVFLFAVGLLVYAGFVSFLVKVLGFDADYSISSSAFYSVGSVARFLMYVTVPVIMGLFGFASQLDKRQAGHRKKSDGGAGSVVVGQVSVGGRTRDLTAGEVVNAVKKASSGSEEDEAVVLWRQAEENVVYKVGRVVTGFLYANAILIAVDGLGFVVLPVVGAISTGEFFPWYYFWHGMQAYVTPSVHELLDQWNE
mmetsp:Transcript_9452/g.26497  ORF Transcript_9452/g.26497 Transcript_9452/m.26497 type:complete len:326 (+) Transcript_9452:79-1056(+)